MDCQICLETFNNLERRAMVLECGHSFCKACIISIYAKKPVFCPLDRALISKSIGDVKINYSLDQIIRSMDSLVVSAPRRGDKLEDSKSINSINSDISPSSVILSQNVMCSELHPLTFYSNIQDRNRTANKPINTTIVLCDICRARNIKSSWSCIRCSYDLCESCFRLRTQNIIKIDVPTENMIVCSKNHQLKYYELIENRKREAGLPLQTVIRCDFCKISGQSTSWSCVACNFDLCEQCFNDQINSKSSLGLPNRLCPNSHFLYYYQNSNIFYRRKMNYSSFISCDSCSVKWNGGSWACRICNFDLCDQCTHKAIEFVNVKCNNNHDLKKTPNEVIRRICNICKVASNCSYNCSSCNFYSCESCIKYFTNATFLNLTCTIGHNLVYSDDQVILYQRRNGCKKFVCNGCKVVLADSKSYHCRRCDLDLCDSCYKNINIGMAHGIRSKCRLGHELSWYGDTSAFYKNSYNCDLCRQNYKNCGSFHCRACKFDVCLKCSKSLIND